MSIVKEFNDMHISYKLGTIAIVIIMPFWYLDLFLFCRSISLDKNIQISIVVSFCLSVCWLTINGFSTLVFAGIYEEEGDEKPKDFNERVAMVSIVSSIFYISIFTAINFILKFKFHTFVYWAFGLTAIKPGIYSIIIAIKDHKKKREKKNLRK